MEIQTMKRPRLVLPDGDKVDLLVATMQPVEDLELFGERWMARAAAALRALSRFYGAAFQDSAMGSRWEMAHARAEKAIHAEFRVCRDQARGRRVVAVGRALADRELAQVLASGDARFDAAERLWIAEALTFAWAMREGYIAFFPTPDAARLRHWDGVLERIRWAGRSAVSDAVDELEELALVAARAAVAFELDQHKAKGRGVAA